jgi:hypothetical protein
MTIFVVAVGCAIFLSFAILPQIVVGQQYNAAMNLTLSGINFTQPVVIADPNGTLTIKNCTFQAALTVKRTTTATTPRPMNFSLSSSTLLSTFTLDGFSTNGSQSVFVLQDNNFTGPVTSTSLSFKASAQFRLFRNRFIDAMTFLTHTYDTSAVLFKASNLFLGTVTLQGSSFAGMSSLILQANDFRVQLVCSSLSVKSTLVLVEYNSVVSLTFGCCSGALAFAIGGSGSWIATTVTIRHNNFTAIQDGTATTATGLLVSGTNTFDGQSNITLFNNSITALHRLTSLGPLVPADAINWRGTIRGGSYVLMPIEDYSLRTVGDVHWCLLEYPWAFNLSGIQNPLLGLSFECRLENDLIITNSSLDSIYATKLLLDGNAIQVMNVNLTSSLTFTVNDFANVNWQIIQLRTGLDVFLQSATLDASNLTVSDCSVGGTMQLGFLDFRRGTNVTVQRNRIRKQFNWICTPTSSQARLLIEGNDIYGYTYHFMSDAIALRIDGGKCESCSIVLRNNNITGEQGSSGGGYGIWASASMTLLKGSQLVLFNNTVTARRFTTTGPAPISAEAIAWTGSFESGSYFEMSDEDYSSEKLFGSVRWNVEAGYPRDLMFNGVQNPTTGGIYIDGSVGVSVTFQCCSLAFISISGMAASSGTTLLISDTNTTSGITLSTASFGANSTFILRRVVAATLQVQSTIFNQSTYTSRNVFVSGRIVFVAVTFVSQAIYDNRFQVALGGESWIGVTLDSNATVSYSSGYWYNNQSSCCKPTVAFSRSASSFILNSARLSFAASTFIAVNKYPGGPAVAFLSDASSTIDNGTLTLACSTLNSSTGVGTSAALGTALEVASGFHPAPDALQLTDLNTYNGDVKLTLTLGPLTESKPFILKNLRNANLRLIINGTSSVDVYLIGLELLALNMSLTLAEGKNLTMMDCTFAHALRVNATSIVRSQVSIVDIVAYDVAIGGQLDSEAVLLLDGLNITNTLTIRQLQLDSGSSATISNCSLGQGIIVDSTVVEGSSNFRITRSNFSRALNSCCSNGLAVDFRAVQLLSPSALIIEDNNVTCVNYYSGGACGGISFGANAQVGSYLRIEGNTVSARSGSFSPQPGIFLDRTYPGAVVQLLENTVSLGTIQVERLNQTFFNLAENIVVTGTITQPGRLGFQGTNSDSAVRLRCNSDQIGPLVAFGTYPAGVEDVQGCGSSCRVEVDCDGTLASSVAGNSPSENCMCSCSYGALPPRCDRLIRGVAPLIPDDESDRSSNSACLSSGQSVFSPISPLFPSQQVCFRDQCTLSRDCNRHAVNVTTEMMDGELLCHCECAKGYAGVSCDTCAGNYSGYPACTPLQCSNLTDCNSRAVFVSGFVATGCSCQCLLGWAEKQCQCVNNFAGERCERCATGYERYPKCTLIPGACTNANCSNHAVEVTGSSPNCTCQCQRGFNGTNCEKCAPNYGGYPICVPRSCNVTIDCDRGAVAVRGSIDTGCICDCKQGFTGSTCGVQLALNRTSRSQRTRTPDSVSRTRWGNPRHSLPLRQRNSSSLSETVSFSTAVSLRQRFEELDSSAKRSSQPTVLGSTAIAKAIANSGTAFAVVSSFVGSPAIAGQAIRARAVFHAIQCAWVDTDLEPSYFDQPLQFSIGNHTLKQYVGATILSTGVLVLFPWIVMLVAWLALSCSTPTPSSEPGTGRDNRLGTIQQRLFSTGALLVLGYMGPTIVKSVVLVLVHEPTILEYEVMVPAGVVLLLFVSITAWSVGTAPNRIIVTLVASETEELEQKLLEQTTPAQSSTRATTHASDMTAQHARKMEFEWKEVSDSAFYFTFLNVFEGTRDADGFATRVYYLFELLFATLLSAIDGIRPESNEDCVYISGGMTAVSTISALYFFVFRPYRSKIESVFSMLNALILIALAGVALSITVESKLHNGDDDAEPIPLMLEIFGWIGTVSTAMFFLQAAILAFWAFALRHKRKVLRQEVESGGSKRDLEGEPADPPAQQGHDATPPILLIHSTVGTDHERGLTANPLLRHR